MRVSCPTPTVPSSILCRPGIAARNFWEDVTANRSWANGGDSQWEHFFAPARDDQREVPQQVEGDLLYGAERDMRALVAGDDGVAVARTVPRA